MSAELLEQLAAARFDALLADAAAGAPLLLRARRPDTLARLTERAVVGPQGFTVETVADGRDPAAALLATARAAGADGDDLGALIADPALRYVLFVADGTGADAGAWLVLAGAFASLRARRREVGPALLVTVSRADAPNGCGYFDDGGLVGPVESAMVARLRRPDAGPVAQAADAAAIETARGDTDLLDRLLDLGEAERFDPCVWATRQPSPDGPAALPWRGEEAECSLWLAHRDPGRLRRRVWRGHLGVLLPWLEEIRAAFLARSAPRLPATLRDRSTGELLQPADYEWGHIANALRPVASSLAASADTLRRVRNALAHGEPAAWADCCKVEAHARALLRWR